MAPGGSKVDLRDLKSRADVYCEEAKKRSSKAVSLPEFRHFSLELLLARHIIVCARGDTIDSGASPALVYSKLLLVALELPGQLLDALLEMLPARLRSNE